MNPGEIEERDRIFKYLSENGSKTSSTQICREFFENHLSGDPEFYVRRVLSNDPRFEEDQPGSWTLVEFAEKGHQLKDLRYCVFDLETTGGVPPLHRIIEIGGVIVEGGKLKDEFKTFVIPDRPIPDYVSRLTGIKSRECDEGLPVEEALKAFLEFSKGSLLVAHNAAFDLNFLHSEYRRVLGHKQNSYGLCTLKLSKVLVPESPAHKLEILSRFFDIQVENRHRALDDARMTAFVLLKILEILGKKHSTLTLDHVYKYCVNWREDYFPVSLTTPEELNVLPEGSGVAHFQNESGKRLHSIAFRDIQFELQSIFYEQTRRSPLIKRLLKRARKFSIEKENCFLNALLTENRLETQSGRDRSLPRERNFAYFIKLVSPKAEEVQVTSRRLRDEAFYFGPLRNLEEVQEKLSRKFERKNVAFHRFPPKSGVEQIYSLKEGNAFHVLNSIFSFSSKSANVIVSIREEEKRRQFLFFREGYLVKKRTVDAESMDRNSIENVLREVLRSYFVDRGLYEILGKVGNLRLNEYNLFMRWLEEHSQAEPNCTIRFLTRKELNQIDHDLVKKITLELLD